jgi:hypothetical protein
MNRDRMILLLTPLRNERSMPLKGPTGQVRSAREWYDWIANGFVSISTYTSLDYNIFNLSLKF